MVNSIDVMRGFPDRAVDLIVTDPPYLVGFKDRQGRQIAGDVTDEWLQPATLEISSVAGCSHSSVTSPAICLP